MFTNLRITNFKGYSDSGSIPLRQLTIIVGANNAGKSTLLQSLLLLKQSMEESKSSNDELITSGRLLDLGGIEDIFRRGARASEETMNLSVSLSPETAARRISRPDTLELSFVCNKETNRITLSKTTVSQRGSLLIGATRDHNGWRIDEMPETLRQHADLTVRQLMPYIFISSTERDVFQEIFPYYQRCIDASQVFSNAFVSVWHVEPLRQDIPRYAQRGKTVTSEFGAGGEYFMMALRERIRRSTSSSSKEVIELVNAWVSSHNLMIENLRIRDLDRTGSVFSLLADERDGFKNMNVANMGRGISQMLPILASVIGSSDLSCGLIEQPEIHLHPAAQAELGDLFIDYVSKNPTRQLIVETHSEHILLRIRRRIAEGMDPKKVCVLYVEKRGRESAVRELGLTTKGRFVDWPKGFFEEGYWESLAITKVKKPKSK